MSRNKFKPKKPEELLFFNEAFEYFNRFDKRDLVFHQDPEELTPNQLRDQMLDELNNLREIIANHPDQKLEKLSNKEKSHYSKFIKYYSVCPICGELNHYHNLKKFFFDEENENIKNKLVNFMDFQIKSNRKLNNFNIDIGIPCCKCFKKHF
ncbi:MAG: hypothetical protein ACFFAO_02565 [Candidatus Hermodarchaeota archaeon]